MAFADLFCPFHGLDLAHTCFTLSILLSTIYTLQHQAHAVYGLPRVVSPCRHDKGREALGKTTYMPETKTQKRYVAMDLTDIHCQPLEHSHLKVEGEGPWD